MNNIDKKIQILKNNNMVPSGLSMPVEMKIIDVRATVYDYHSYKYAEANESFENRAVSIQFQHSKVDNPFWITIFDGATCRERSTSCIVATFDAIINSNYEIDNETGTVYLSDCITLDEKEFDGRESISELLFAFNCKLISGDESGLYCNDEPTFENDSDVLENTALELLGLNFEEFYGKVSKISPDITKVKELYAQLMSVSSDNLYEVTVVLDNEIQSIDKFLSKDEAEKIFIKKCNEYYSEEGMGDYMIVNDIDLETGSSLSIEQFEDYHKSNEWYDNSDTASVQLNKM